MRKSAVSVRSGAGMPAHMAGEEKRHKKKRKRQWDLIHVITLHLGRHFRKCPLRVTVLYVLTIITNTLTLRTKIYHDSCLSFYPVKLWALAVNGFGSPVK